MTPTQHTRTTTQRRPSKIQLYFILFLVTMAIIWFLVDTKIKRTVITSEPVVMSVYLTNFPNHSNIPSSEKPHDVNNNRHSSSRLLTDSRFKALQETIRYSERQKRSEVFRKTLEKSRKARFDHPKRGSFSFSRLNPGRMIKSKNESIQKHEDVITKEVITEEIDEEFLDFTLSTTNLAVGGTPIRNIIFATWRSGSTFVGSVVDSHPGMFYDYEPLLYLYEKQVQPGPEEKESLQLINQIFSCDYSAVAHTKSEYLRHSWFKTKHQTSLERQCRRSPMTCHDPYFLTKIRRKSPYISVKTVRLRVPMGEKLLNKTDNLRLLLLIRDPWGIMNSRMKKKLNWCKGYQTDCSSVQKLCGYLDDDLEHAKILRKQYPDRFLAIRYEDVVLNPGPAFKKIFEFFRLQLTDNVKAFIEREVNTYPNGEAYAFKWKRDFSRESFENVISIHNNCSKVMDWWGYKMVMDKMELRKVDPLLNPPWPEMIIKPNNSLLIKDGQFK